MKKLFFILLTIFAAPSWAQQKAMFTQYMFNGLAINPAYSSVDDALALTGVYRQQWTGFDGAPSTQSVTIHSPIKRSNTSAGFMLMRDRIGEVINETGAYVTGAQRVQISDETYVSAGIIAGVSQYSANYSSIYDNVSGTDPLFMNQNDYYANVGIGAMIFSDKFYAGISSPFLMSGSISTTQTANNNKPHFMLQGGYLLPIASFLKLKPNVLMKFVRGAPIQIDLNANLLIAETTWIGGSLRSLDSFDALAQIQVRKNIQVGFSYDFITSGLANAQRGSHEIMLKFRVPPKGANFPRCYF